MRSCSRSLSSSIFALLLVVGLPSTTAFAQEPGCQRRPYHASIGKDFIGSGNQTQTLTFEGRSRVGIEIEHVSVRISSFTLGGNIYSTGVTLSTRLNGVVASHFLSGGDQTSNAIYATQDSPKVSAWQVRLYSDPNSPVRLVVDTMVPAADPVNARIEWTISGQLASAACWTIAP
jgi:hypothetical protein